MALFNQTLKLEITPGGVPPKLHVTEYDENMQVVAQLFQRGQYYEIPSGTTAKVEGTLAGHPFSADATVDGSNVTFELTKSMTAYAGRAWTKIKLTKDGKPVSTCGFWLECDRAGVEAGDVIGAPGFDEQIKDAVDKWLDEHGGSGNVAVAITDMDGYKIAPTGTILVATAGTQLVSAPIPVTAGEKLRITASSKYGNSLYALYDASGAMVDNQTAAATAEGTAVEELAVTVHADAVTLRVAWDKSVTDTAYAVIRVGGQTAPDGPLVGVKCAVIGDSVIEAAAAPNAGLVELMAASTGAEITNLGVGGTGWMRGQEDGTAYYQRVADIPADTQRVLLYGSGNDRELTLGDPADTGTETVCGCVNATLDAVYAHVPTAWVGIIAPAPWQHYPPYESGNAMELLANALGAICRRRGVPYLDLYHSSGLRPWDDAFRELAYNNADGIHPNDTGYGIIAPQCSAFLVGGGTAAKLAAGSGLTTEQINALDGMFKVCAFTKADVSTEYTAFKTAFGIADSGGETEVTMSSISVTYSGGDVPVGTAVTDLTGIVVTATYSDGSTETVTGYTLSGEIVEGDNTIIVTYNGKTATFTVIGTVEHERVEHIVSGQTFPVTLTWKQLVFDVTPALAHYVNGGTPIPYYDVEIDVESITSKNAYIAVAAGGGAFVRNASDYAGRTGTLKMTGEIWHSTMSDASQIKLSCNKGTETSNQTAVITGVRIYER